MGGDGDLMHPRTFSPEPTINSKSTPLKYIYDRPVHQKIEKVGIQKRKSKQTNLEPLGWGKLGILIPLESEIYIYKISSDLSRCQCGLVGDPNNRPIYSNSPGHYGIYVWLHY